MSHETTKSSSQKAANPKTTNPTHYDHFHHWIIMTDIKTLNELLNDDRYMAKVMSLPDGRELPIHKPAMSLTTTSPLKRHLQQLFSKVASWPHHSRSLSSTP
jgi:hypothetical protein